MNPNHFIENYLFNMINLLVDKKNRVEALDIAECLWEDIDCAADIEKISEKLSQKAKGRGQERLPYLN